MEKKGPKYRPGRRLRIIKALVASEQYSYSRKVRLFIHEGNFALEDMERCILSAEVIEKVEPDELETAIDGCKYTIHGTNMQGEDFYTCGKIVRGAGTEAIYFFITAHEQR